MKQDLPEVDMELTGKIIKGYMKQNRMDVFDLALILRMRNTASIYSWLRGDHLPNVNYLMQMSHIFGCTIEDLLGVQKED